MQKQTWAWQGQLLWLRDQQRPWECRQEGLVTPAVGELARVPWRGDISNRALRTSQISSETGRRKAEDDVVWEKHNISRRGNDRWPDIKTVKRSRWNYFNKFFLVLHIHYNIFFFGMQSFKRKHWWNIYFQLLLQRIWNLIFIVRSYEISTWADMSQGLKSHPHGWQSPHWLAKHEKNLKDKRKIREASKLLYGSWFESEPSQMALSSAADIILGSGGSLLEVGGVCLAKGH